MTGISGIIWCDSDRLARREGGFYVTTGQLVFMPTMNAQARAEVKRIKEELRAKDMLARAMARRDRNSTGLGG